MQLKKFILSFGLSICLHSLMILFIAFNYPSIIILPGLILLIIGSYLVWKGQNKDYRFSKTPLIGKGMIFQKDGILTIILFLIFISLTQLIFMTDARSSIFLLTQEGVYVILSVIGVYLIGLIIKYILKIYHIMS